MTGGPVVRLRDRVQAALGRLQQAADAARDSAAATLERTTALEASAAATAEQVAQLRHEAGAARETAAALTERLAALEAAAERRHQETVRLMRLVRDDEAGARRHLARARRSEQYLRAFTDERPLVSIPVPTYTNHRALAERALPSLLAQTYENIEVVIVGDAAPAETEAVVRSFGDDRVRYRNLPYRGPYEDEQRRRWLSSGTAPFNAAVEDCQGAWIAPFSDDDACTPDHVERLVAYVQEHRLELGYGVIHQHEPGGAWTELGAFPPANHAFGLQAAVYHHALAHFPMELGDALFDLPNDWGLAERWLRAGVRMGMLQHHVTDYYPSYLWGEPGGSP